MSITPTTPTTARAWDNRYKIEAGDIVTNSLETGRVLGYAADGGLRVQTPRKVVVMPTARLLEKSQAFWNTVAKEATL